MASNILSPEETDSLAVLAAAGDREAMDRLFDSTYGIAVWWARQYFKCGIDRDDIFQLAFFGLLRSVPSYERSRGRFTWHAWRCIQRELCHASARHKTASRLSLIGNSGRFNSVLFADLPEDDGSEDREWVAYLLSRVSRVEPLWAEVVTLRYGLGGSDPLTTRETAKVMGVSHGTVNKYERWALDLLRDMAA